MLYLHVISSPVSKVQINSEKSATLLLNTLLAVGLLWANVQGERREGYDTRAPCKGTIGPHIIKLDIVVLNDFDKGNFHDKGSIKSSRANIAQHRLEIIRFEL